VVVRVCDEIKRENTFFRLGMGDAPVDSLIARVPPFLVLIKD